MQNKSAAARVQDNLQEVFKGNLAPGDAYVKFQLTSDITALLSMERVQKSLIIEAGQITPLPNMSESTIGITSSRERVFCVFDLPLLLNLPQSIFNPRKYQILVIQTKEERPIYIGFAVNQLLGIMRIATENIHSSLDKIPSNIMPYVCGSFSENGKIFPLFQLDLVLEVLTQSI